MGSIVDGLPEGFTVDTNSPPPTAEPSALPEGFKLDATPATVSAPPPVSEAPPGFTVDPPAPDTALSSYPIQFGKSFVQGAGGLAASTLQELPASAKDFDRTQIPLFDRIDAGEKVRLNDDAYGYSAMSPQQRQEFRAKFVPATNAPISEDPLYKAGTAVKSATTFTPEPGFEGQTWTGDLGGGAGSMAAGMLTSMIPYAGPAAASTMFVAAGRDEARQNALNAKATPEQQARAAQLGTVAGATDIVDIVLPYFGSMGHALGFVKRVGVKALESAFIEGGQEGVQQFMQNVISQQVHTPDQDLGQGVARSAAIGGILGAGAGGTIGGLQRPASATEIASPEEIKKAWDTLKTAPTEELTKASRNTVEPSPIFYSQLQRTVETKGPNSASPSQWMATLQNAQGVKAEEVDATGLGTFLASQTGPVSKADILAHLEDNQVQVTEVLKEPYGSTPESTVRYSVNATPGPSSNYRELLLTLPEQTSEAGPRGWGDTAGGTADAVNFRGAHYTEPNVVSHIRFTQREDLSGKSVLHIEEIQSDWHQAGRKNGYKDSNASKMEDAAGRALDASIDALHDKYGKEWLGQVTSEEWADHQRLNAEYNKTVKAKSATTPDGPFKTSWPELSMKRMLRWAADNGFSRISWNNGSLATRFAAGIAEPARRPKTVAGIHEFYDRVIPSIARKYAKKLGGTYGETVISTSNVTYFPRQRPDGMWGLGVSANGRMDENIYPVLGNNETGDEASFRPTEQDIVQFIADEEGTTQERVGYIDIPAKASTFVQEGLPLFSRTTAEVRIFSDEGLMERRGEGDPLILDVDRAVKTIEAFAKRFGVDTRLEIVLTDSTATSLNPDTDSIGKTVATAQKLSNGNYRITVDVSSFIRASDVYVTLLHEFGHIVMWENFAKLSPFEQLSIRAAFDKFTAENVGSQTLGNILRRRDNAIVVYNNLRPGRARLADLSPEAIRYWAGFEEWFAEQVARWGTTSEVALTVADQFFTKMGRIIRAITENISSRLGISFEPSRAMKEWLDSFMETAPPLAKPIFDQTDIGTKKTNQDALNTAAKDIPAVEKQPETVGISAGIDKLFNDPKNPAPPPVAEAAAHADRMNKFYKYMAGLDQLVDANPLFTPLLRYAERVREMHLEESKIHDAALRVSKRWRKLGVQGENLTALLDDITNMVYRTTDEVARGVGRHPTQQEFDALVKQHKVGSEALTVFNSVKQMFDGFLTLTGSVAKQEAIRTISNPKALADKLDQINAMIANLRSRPYFPFMRFGRHFVQVKDAAGKTVYFETFERRGLVSAPSRQRAAAKRLEQAKQPGEVVTHGVLPESADPLIGMPPLLLQAMRERLELTPEQLDALEQLQYQMSPGASFKHRFQHKSYTAGYSMDFKRSFARYFFHGARYYAKTKYAWALRDDIKAAQAVNGNKAGEIANYMSDHLKNTVLDAKGDFGIFKAGIFLWALGYVPAAAAQNLTQTPMITFPFLAGKFGEHRATPALVKAMTDLRNFYVRGKYDNNNDFFYRAFSYGIKTGRISETQAPELAGMSQGSNLIDGIGGNKVQRGWSHFMEKSAWMFEMAEQFNRRVAYRAALDLAQKNPSARVVSEAVAKYNDEYKTLLGEYTDAEARAIVTANHTVDQTQYVYARYARPRFMRGRVTGTLFVFKKYIQSTLFMLGHNKSDVLPRYLVMAMLMGGLGGVPGFDDMKDILKALAYWLFGKDFDIEKKTRQFILDHFNGEVPPDMVLHGLARRGFGLPTLLDMMGSFATGRPGRGFDPQKQAQNIPFPVIDRSRALSMGNILPVQIGKMFGPQKDVNSTIAEQTQNASGAAFSVAFNVYKAIVDNHMEVSDPKRWERAVPRMLGMTSKAFRAFQEGRERSRGGPNAAATVVNYDVRDTEQMMEILALGMGYQPLRVQAKWDSTMAKVEVQKFFDLSRSALLEQMHEAVSGHNQKEINGVREMIIKFNRDLPDWAKGKEITSDTLSKSIQTRERAKQMQEAGLPTQKSNIGISREMDRLYPEATVDVRRVR